MKPGYIAINRGTETTLLSRVQRTERYTERLRGLLGTANLTPGTGLLLAPCNSIHTFFMRYPIDAVFLNQQGFITRLARSLKPWRLCGSRRSCMVLETRDGVIEEASLQVGEQLIWRSR